MLLRVNDIHVHYGPIAALRGISLEVSEADFVTIIGSNGAGKSTTLRTISGLNHPSSGSIVFDGQPIDNLSAAPDPSGEADLVRGDEKIIIAAEQGGLKDAFKRAKKLSGTGLRWVVINREDVFAANVFVQLNANLTIGKLTDARVAEWEANVLRNCVCESGISVTTEDHQIVCHE